MDDFDFGDIKCVWELSRFAWAFPLARAYKRTGENCYAEGFWSLFEDWLRRNLPNRGPNWMCGQEATFRLMAATFARQVCRPAPATTAERVARFQEFVRVTGRRIAANIDYALSQSNNHGVSECIGLLTAALLVPTREESAGWLALGLRRLEGQLGDLVYADGGFAQHSANYHRVLLHDLLWCLAVLRAAHKPTPGWLDDAAKRALGLIASLMNPSTGRVPLWGANDGALVLPLADADFLDFRPLVQAAAAVIHGQRWLPLGPWDEAALWLGGCGSLPETITPVRWMPTGLWRQAGLAQIGGRESRIVFRCPTAFRHRPSQADLLHVDVEWRGQAIALDAGTYSYNTGGRWVGALSGAAVHNTITIDGQEPMQKPSRFLYLPWPRGSVRIDPAGGFEATHNGWNRLAAQHIRKIRSPEAECFLVEDWIICAGCRRVRLHWLLADLPHQLDPSNSRLILDAPPGKYVISWEVPAPAVVSLIRADGASDRGWWSPHYLQALPALSLAIEFEVRHEVLVKTTFGPSRK
jgi:hypothetical protein